MAIRLNLREFLESNNLKPARVEQHAREVMGLTLGENTIYRMMGNTEPKRLDLEALGSIMASAAALLGRPVPVADLLAYEEADTQETAAVLADHPAILERAQRLKAGTSTLIPWQDVKAELNL